MARIRSVHPALFTEEAWVSCSPLARLLIIGLWTDADDQGVFEWKPLQLKMRLLPGDEASAPPLLAELADAGLIQRFEVDGRAFGAIRDFRRRQRPKSPTASHPLPNHLREYVGLERSASEPPLSGGEQVEEDFGSTGEIVAQGRGEEGRVEEEEGSGEGVVALPALLPAPAPAEKRRSRFAPADWSPKQSHYDLAFGSGMSSEEFDRQERRFRNCEFDKPKSDWDRAFSNWLDRELSSASANRGGGTRRSGVDWAREGLS